MLSNNLFLIAKKALSMELLLRKMCVVCIMNKTQKVKIPEIGNSSVHYSGWEVWSGNFDSQKWERGKEALGMELTWAIRVGQVPAQNVERGHGDAHRRISDDFTASRRPSECLLRILALHLVGTGSGFWQLPMLSPGSSITTILILSPTWPASTVFCAHCKHP